MVNGLESQLCGLAWMNESFEGLFRDLCLNFGGRFSGSRDVKNAADFIESQLLSYHMDSVSQENFPLTSWNRGSAALTIISPLKRDFVCLSLPYSPSCNQSLALFDAGMGLWENYEKATESPEGKAVLVLDDNPKDGHQLHRLQKYLIARERGAAAFIFVQKAEGMLAPTGTIAYNQQLAPEQTIPSLGVPREVGDELRLWSSRGPVTLKIEMDNSLVEGLDSNVIADLNVSANQGPEIILCGHYDGHDIAQGAFDNASGTAVVMELARIFTALGPDFSLPVRFILFSGEELGLLGSHHYVASHSDELKDLKLVINCDCVGNEGLFYLMTQMLSERVVSQYKVLAKEIGDLVLVEDHFVPFSDHFPFLLKGVPGIFCVTPGAGGRGWGHTIADTFEKVSTDTMKKVVMYLGRFIIKLSEGDSLVSQKIPREKIVTALKKRKLEQMLKYEGHWDFQD